MSKVIFSVYPNLRYGIGAYRFENGMLTFDDGVVQGDPELTLVEFERLITTLMPIEKNLIKRLDQSIADKLAADLARTNGPGSRVQQGASGGLSPNEEAAMRAQAIPQFGNQTAPVVVPTPEPIAPVPAPTDDPVDPQVAVDSDVVEEPAGDETQSQEGEDTQTGNAAQDALASLKFGKPGAE